MEDINGEQSIQEIECLSTEYQQIVQKINKVKAELEDLYNDMVSIEKKTISTLATALKSHEPKVDLNLSDNQLRLGDIEQVAVIRPTNGAIEVDGINSFLGPASDALKHILASVMPECKNHTGKLFLDGRNATIIDLYKYKESI